MTDIAKRNNLTAYAAACNLRLERIIEAQNAQIHAAQPDSQEIKTGSGSSVDVLYRLIERIKSI